MTLTSLSFIVQENNNTLTSISHPQDSYGMNWIESAHALGEVICPGDIEVKKSVELSDNVLDYTVTFHNGNSYDVFVQKGSIGIYVPFNDSYGKASVCMTGRCHAHLYMGGGSSYAMCLRMGGEAPHLGMILSEGELAAYSIERENKSNDRGDFILHPPFIHLLPSERYTVKMRFFWHNGKEDFQRIIRDEYGALAISSEHFTYFKGENVTVRAMSKNAIQNASVYLDGERIPCEIDGNTVSARLSSDETGERRIKFEADGKTAYAKIYISEDFDTLLAARCGYIAKKQQFKCPESALDGAYLTYDTRENTFVYDYRRRDINSSRERISMALLILLYLKRKGDKIPAEEYEYLHNSLKSFTAFFKREIYNSTTGDVTNDIGYENSKVRLYNYPWPARFFLELYELENNKEYLFDAYNIMRRYYEQDGKKFYAFTIPALRMCELLQAAEMTEEREEMLANFREHAEVMIANAKDYPAHEVSYEQSIVAPAAEFMLQMYFLTGERRYLDEADKQMATTELFSGAQPDNQLYMCAIRHWDGFWFGKRRLYGDTFPHYWSVLSANAFFKFGKARNDKKYLDMAEDAFRGQLCQFKADGSATCATLFPLKVNGNLADYEDQWANDQDWALVYYSDYLEERNK